MDIIIGCLGNCEQNRTGLTKTKDSINNIYDLAGNMNEWTLEGVSSNVRVSRGGGVYENASANRGQSDYTPSSQNDVPYNGGRRGSRVSIYIK